MGRKSIELTPEIESQITAFLRAGSFPHVAAEAAGVPGETFDEWVKMGEKKSRKYRSFYLKVMQAKAQARLAAEIAAMKEDPLRWLTSGPGKETATYPGWAAAVRAVPRGDQEPPNPMMSPEMQAAFATILEALVPFPEARGAVARALQPKEKAKSHGE